MRELARRPQEPKAAQRPEAGLRNAGRSAAPLLPAFAPPKLIIAAADGQLEHEANRTADQVMGVRAAWPSDVAEQLGGRNEAPSRSGEAHGLVSEVLASSGQPLDARLRAEFEPRFGHDFSAVRVHVDEAGANSARALGALAYTSGSHIAFAPNQYAPHTLEGRRLLAHELAHVLQLRSATVSLQRQPAAPTAQAAPSLPNVAPGLGPRQAKEADDRIKAGDFQGAVDVVTFYAGGAFAKNYSIDDSLLAGGRMVFDAAVTWADASTAMGGWDFSNNKADPAKVRIGPSSFSSVSYLYSVIMHEYQHVLFQQSLSNQNIANQAHGHGGMDTDEVNASAWELLHATETGLAKLPDKVAVVWHNLNDEFWQLDPAAQAAARPLATRALQAARRYVRGSQEVLDPFQP